MVKAIKLEYRLGIGYAIGAVANALLLAIAVGYLLEIHDQDQPFFTYFAGTFVRHPLVLATANAVLDFLNEKGPQLQENLNQRTDQMVTELNDFFLAEQAPLKIVNFGSLFKPKLTESLPFGELLFPWLRSKGIHVWDARPCFLAQP